MECERELIAEMRQNERERQLKELEQALELLDKYPTPLMDLAKVYVKNKIMLLIEGEK
jgi:hypothetical protein